MQGRCESADKVADSTSQFPLHISSKQNLQDTPQVAKKKRGCVTVTCPAASTAVGRVTVQQQLDQSSLHAPAPVWPQNCLEAAIE